LGPTYPLIVHQQHEVVQVIGDGNSAESICRIEKKLRVEYANGNLSHEVLSKPGPDIWG